MIGGLATANVRTPGQNPVDMIQLDLPHNAGSLGAAPKQELSKCVRDVRKLVSHWPRLKSFM